MSLNIKSEDAHRIVAANDRFQHRLHGMTRGKLRRLAKGTKASASKALLPAIPTRRLHQVAVDFPISLLAITVVHGPGKYTGSLIALLAAMRRLATAVALLSLSRAFWASAVTARTAAAAAIAPASLASLMMALLAVGSLRRRGRNARFGSGRRFRNRRLRTGRFGRRSREILSIHFVRSLFLTTAMKSLCRHQRTVPAGAAPICRLMLRPGSCAGRRTISLSQCFWVKARE